MVQCSGGTVVNELVCEVRRHKFDANRCIPSESNGLAYGVSLTNKEDGKIVASCQRLYDVA